MIQTNRKRSSTEKLSEEPLTKVQCKSEKWKDVKKPKALKSSGNKPEKKKQLTKPNVLKPGLKKPTEKREKPNWSEFKKKKKELRTQRRERKFSYFDATCKAKQLWEKSRRGDCPAEQRNKLADEIYQVLAGNLHKIVFCHDLSRIVQWLLKTGPPPLKETVTQELGKHVPDMLQSRYACFCVKNMLKYGTNKSKRTVVRSIYGNVVKLASHNVAAPILGTVYSKYASGIEKYELLQEFFGDMYKHGKESDVSSLTDIFEKMPDMKNAVLSSVKKNLTRILDKKLFHSPLIHSLLLEYLKNCSPEEQEEICGQIQVSLPTLAQTKDGAHVATMCIFQATNKVKKMIMKSLKGHVMDLAKSEHGYVLLLALFDAVDDTVFLKKTLIPEILTGLWDLMNDEHGRKVLLYLVAHRDPHFFHPSHLEMLKMGSELSKSKKDMAARVAEILEVVLIPLLEDIRENTSKWMSKGSMEMVTLAILKKAKGSLAEKTFPAIADYICESSSEINGHEVDIVEDSATHMMLKKLIQHDKERQLQGNETFSSFLVSRMNNRNLQSWIKSNRGCYLLVFLMEYSGKPTVEKLLSKLGPYIDMIEQETFSGGEILRKLIIEHQK